MQVGELEPRDKSIPKWKTGPYVVHMGTPPPAVDRETDWWGFDVMLFNPVVLELLLN